VLGLGGHDNSGSKDEPVFNTDPHGFLYRIVAGVAGFAIIGFGAAPLLQRGDLFSTNWLGELVFAPLAIVLGLMVIVFALFKPEWLMAKRVERKHRHGDKP
jgi:formate-dependent nitrite reductase membrane component NrfD